MWFKLASATFGTHLGSMSSLSNSISIKYTANGFSYTTTSVAKTASSASLVLNLMNGWECKSTPTVSVSGAAVVNGTPTWSNNELTIAIKPASSESTFEAAGSIINVSVSGATATSSGGSGGVNPPAGDTTTVDITSQFTFTEGKMVSAKDGKISTWNGWVANENYVDISNYSSIEIKMSKTNSTTTGTGLALYDADKNFISGIPHTDGVATYGTMIKTIEVLDNIKYVRTTYWSTSNADYKTEFGDFYCIATV